MRRGSGASTNQQFGDIEHLRVPSKLKIFSTYKAARTSNIIQHRQPLNALNAHTTFESALVPIYVEHEIYDDIDRKLVNVVLYHAM